MALTSDDAANPVTQEVQETHLANGSSSESPLEVEDGNRETSMVAGHEFCSKRGHEEGKEGKGSSGILLEKLSFAKQMFFF